jgi:hypothetical protein
MLQDSVDAHGEPEERRGRFRGARALVEPVDLDQPDEQPRLHVDVHWNEGS